VWEREDFTSPREFLTSAKAAETVRSLSWNCVVRSLTTWAGDSGPVRVELRVLLVTVREAWRVVRALAVFVSW
jgi:hypothetical protein